MSSLQTCHLGWGLSGSKKKGGLRSRGGERKKETDSWIKFPDPIRFRTLFFTGLLGILCTFERRYKRIVEVKKAVQHPVLGIEEIIVGVAIVHVSNDAGRCGWRGRQAWGAWC